MPRDSKSSHNPYDRNETESDRMEAAHHRRLREIHGDEYEHEQSHWGKGGKSNPSSHTDE